MKRRILCIDGGGILGVFPAALLAELEQHLKHPVGSYFDLIAGTSTGGIIALGLSLGHSASEILSLYQNRGPEIFDKHRGSLANFALGKFKSIRQLYRNKYSSNALQEVLEEIFCDKRLGEARTRLVIPAWNPVARSVLYLQNCTSSAVQDRLSNACCGCCVSDRRRTDIFPPAHY